MIIYRAMCDEEAELTLRNKRPNFLRRFKWFSHNLEFIKDRVQGGNFNNSKYKPERYNRLLSFEVKNLNNCNFISNNEIQFDRRKNPKITLIEEIKKPST